MSINNPALIRDYLGDYYKIRFPGQGVYKYKLSFGLPGIEVWRGGFNGWTACEDLGVVDAILEAHEEIKIVEK